MFIETDQNQCYDVRGNQIDCRGSGQDASFNQSARDMFTNRFKAYGDVIEDCFSGLVWKTNAGLSEFPLDWRESHQFIDKLNQSTEPKDNSWRLPSRHELFSLVSHQFVNPSLPRAHPFNHVFNGYYWTLTTCSRLPGQAWYVHLGGGRVYRGMKHGSYMVWPVRGKMQDPADMKKRFSVKNGIYFDSDTGRSWYVSDSSIGKARTWDDALDTIHRLNDRRESGHNDWRLPNIRELESLVDDSRHTPAFAKGFSSRTSHVTGFWSSTTSVYEPSYAWVLYIMDGTIGVGYKPQPDFHTLAVRG